jgi:predicted dehydrogenase
MFYPALGYRRRDRGDPIEHPLPARQDAIGSGKHVPCEKPLFETAKEAKELVELAAASRRMLMVGHVFRFNPGIERLRDLVLAGEVGRLYYLSAVRTNLGPIRHDANAAYDLAAHDIAIFNWSRRRTAGGIGERRRLPPAQHRGRGVHLASTPEQRGGGRAG